jgi:NAD(P)-dependent dehydrogenase (short-subunit alcohol dehydrogenase family)
LFVVKLDVSDEAEAREVAKQAVAKFGRIGLLVNNAG